MNIIISSFLQFLLLTLVTGHSIIAAFTETQAPPAEPPVPVTLFFASDYQYLGDWPYPEDTLRGILETVEEDGKDIDGIFYCGDYSNIDGHSNYEIDPDEYIDEIKEVIYDFVPEEAPVLFVQGNHDILTDEIVDSGLHEYDSYLVYVLNTQTDNPWKQGITEGSKEKVEASAAALKACLQELIEAGETRPVFVVTHVPLHFTGRTSSLYKVGDNLYSEKLFDVLNEAGEDLNIVYFYGHNHAKGWDSYMGGSSVFRTEGDFLLIPDWEAAEAEGTHYTDEYTAKTLHFTYLSAGYTGYYTGSGADKTLTGTVCVIYPDHMEFTRYEDGGRHKISAAGAANPYLDDTELIPEEYYGTELESPVEVPLRPVPQSAP